MFKGDAGKAVLLYLFLAQNKRNYNEGATSTLLDRISDNIAKVDLLDFNGGLAGIGWFVEWVSQNGFVEIDSNEILEDIDDTLYKSVVYASDLEISLAKGTLGKLLFFWYRYISKNKYANRLKNIFHEECLVLLTDDLYEKIFGIRGIAIKDVLQTSDILNIGHVAYFLSSFLSLKINEPTVESTLYEVVSFIDDYLATKTIKPTIDNGNSLCFLSLCYLLAAEHHNHSYWKHRAQFFLDIIQPQIKDANIPLLHSINFAILSVIKQVARDVPVDDSNISDIVLSNHNGKNLLHWLASSGSCSKEVGIFLLMMFDSTELE